MKIILIEPKAPGIHVYSKFKLPRLGLPILGALLEQKLKIKPKILIEDLGPIDWDEVFSSDLIGLSSITATAPRAYSLIEKIKKKRSTPVVMGGPHVTFLPEEALMKGADFVVRGEGEKNFIDLVQAIRENKTSWENIPGISFKMGDQIYHNPPSREFLPLDNLPWPNLRLIQNWQRMPILPMLTSRGCPFNCTFCSVTKMFGRYYRTRPIDEVIAELEFWLAIKRWRSVFFYDDNFACQPERTKQLFQKIINRRLKIRWTAQVRVDVAQDEELLKLMKMSGGYVLYMGLESINPRSLEKYRKKQTVEEIARAIDLIHKYGMQVHGMFVLGSDEDDRQTIDETVKFARKMKIDTVQFMVLTPLPGTETYFELFSQGRLLEADWSKYSGHHVVFKPRLLSAYDLQKEAAIKAMKRFYSFWRCWQLGLQFRWRRLAIFTYARHAINQWLGQNRSFLKKLRLLSLWSSNSPVQS